MRPATRLIATGLVLLSLGGTGTVRGQADVAATVAQCLSCHDFGPEAPVHQVLAGSHSGGDGEQRGCPDCHGPSEAHTRAPTRNAPDVSFGPHWTATSAAQDGQCLACHEQNVARHWRDTLHMLNNLTCVTCHDIHVEEDRVLFEQRQAEVCTICHKAQKQGIHGMEKRASRNPPCTTCHNPHRQETAEAEMLRNGSAGCNHCHDLVRMAQRGSVSDKAKSYHKVMARPGATCLQCHEGIAHAPKESVPPMHPVPRRERDITLFYPGMADSDWLLQAHPGSQPLRQGAPCQRCHRGEEAAMGRAQAGDFAPASRQVRVAFATEGDDLLVTLQWQGGSDDRAVSLMWGGPENDVFQRGACFAACHSDMPGMSRDRGLHSGKYLPVSRAQQPQVGQPAMLRSDAELDALLREGQGAELWRIDLQAGTVSVAQVLASTQLEPSKLIQLNKHYENGRWQLVLRRKLHNTEMGINFSIENKYTLGVAINGAGNPGAGHWVSLPLTLGFGSDDTDFTAE